LLVTLLGEQKVEGLAVLIDRAVPILPLALSLYLRLIHPPTHPHRALAALKRFLQQRTLVDDPTVDGGVIQLHPAFFHEFLDVACA
jgi:hypothetical protein